MKQHEIIVARDTEQHLKVRCGGKDCPLCQSTAENRARIVFVKASDA